MTLLAVTSWNHSKAIEWVSGLEEGAATAARAAFAAHHVSGRRLLLLCPSDLRSMGIESVGQQEIILGAIQRLSSLLYGLDSDTISSLAADLAYQARNLRNELTALHKRQLQRTSRPSLPSSDSSVTSSPRDLEFAQVDAQLELGATNEALKHAVTLLSSVRGLLYWVLSVGEQYAEIFNFGRALLRCSLELNTCANMFLSRAHPLTEFVALTKRMEEMCNEFRIDCRDPLMITPCALEIVTLRLKASDELGLEMQQHPSGAHLITWIVPQSVAYACDKLVLGDEILQVNYITVVGWQPAKLEQLLRDGTEGRESSELILMVRKRPPNLPEYGRMPKHSVPGGFSLSPSASAHLVGSAGGGPALAGSRVVGYPLVGMNVASLSPDVMHYCLPPFELDAAAATATGAAQSSAAASASATAAATAAVRSAKQQAAAAALPFAVPEIGISPADATASQSDEVFATSPTTDESAGASGDGKCLLAVRPTGHESVRVRRMTVGAFSQVEESEQTGSAAARACGSFKRRGPVAAAGADACEDSSSIDADAASAASSETCRAQQQQQQPTGAEASDEQQLPVDAETAAASSSPPPVTAHEMAAYCSARDREARCSVVSIPCISFTSETQSQAQARDREDALAADRKGSVSVGAQKGDSERDGDRRIIVGRLNTAVLPRVRKLSSSGLESPFFKQTPAACAPVVSSFITSAAAAMREDRENEERLRSDTTCSASSHSASASTLPKSVHTVHTAAAASTGQKQQQPPPQDRQSALCRDTELDADGQRRPSFAIGSGSGAQAAAGDASAASKAEKKRGAAGGLSLASAAAAAEPSSACGYPSAPPPTPTLKTIVALATSGRSSDAKDKAKGKLGKKLNRRVSTRDLGPGECQGWLWRKRPASGKFGASKWAKRWFVLKLDCLYYYKHDEDARAEGLLHLRGFQVAAVSATCGATHSPSAYSVGSALDASLSLAHEKEHRGGKARFQFRVYNEFIALHLAAEYQEERTHWLTHLEAAATCASLRSSVALVDTRRVGFASPVFTDASVSSSSPTPSTRPPPPAQPLFSGDTFSTLTSAAGFAGGGFQTETLSSSVPIRRPLAAASAAADSFTSTYSFVTRAREEMKAAAAATGEGRTHASSASSAASDGTTTRASFDEYFTESEEEPDAQQDVYATAN